MVGREEGPDFLSVNRVPSQVEQVRTDPDVTVPSAAEAPLLHLASFPEG